MKGTQEVNVGLLKSLRRQNCLSQEDLYHACRKRSLRLSLATIKRAEAGRNVSYRTIRELAAFYAVPLQLLVKPGPLERNEREAQASCP
ncbi:helix-turn-helix transcriptional regulator [Gallaecimonas sp. GXIMD4217]|uniref:helix-turn-helix transcriptional regulator n=1 Tax=Gallaecimonas sp. GXIMD4217 TaxID=3131927 RepID=UPI00311B3CF2